MKLFITILSLSTLAFFAGPGTAFATPTLPNINTNNIFNITSYGASVASADNASAIQSAINAATAATGGGTVEIPAGVFLSGPISLKSKVNLQIDAGAILRMLPYGTYPSSGANFISAINVNDVEISGAGAIDGQGADWWPNYKTITRPRMISFQGCNRQLIQDVTLSNSPMFHLAFSSSKGNITVQGVTIFSPPSSGVANPSHNTDACDVSGTNILVQNCNISVGDDNFTCGGGTADVLLTNNTYGTGHGVSVGSYTDGGVSNITVINCSFNGTDNGIRLKSQRDRGGLVQNLHYLNLTMTNVMWPLLIYGYYEYGLGTLTYVDPVFAATTAATNSTSLTSTTPIFHNITFSNIVATAPAGRPPLMVWGLPEAPASNIVFQSVHITSSSTLAPGIYNATNIQFIDCSFKLPAGVRTVQSWNAGMIFTNSSASTNLWLLDGLTTNGLGNSLAFYNAPGSLSNTNALDAGPLTLSASTFTVSNNLTLFSTTVLNFTLGTNTTELAVVGNLALGGTINIADGPGFTAGTYTLMTYTGILSGAMPALGTVPAGYNYSFDTNTAGQVKLVVTSTAQTAPDAPTNLVATAANALVNLNWNSATGATSYNLKRGLAQGGPYPTVFSGLTATNYTDTLVTNGTAYFYVVSASNTNGESTNSAEASATPLQSSTIVVTTNVFTDDFSASTVNSTSPSSPDPTSTSYEIVSSKSWNPTPGIATGHLTYGISATKSGSIEAQALFASSPVTLATNGDRITLIVTFTNTSGLLAQDGAMGFGLYNSGANYPVPGGLNGVGTTSYSTNATGNAQTWAGYVGQLSFTNAASQILTRSPQTGTANNNQDLVTTGSGSSSYNFPSGTTVGTATTAASVVQPVGSPCTEVLTITLTAANTLAITNSLYSGTDTNGTLLSQFGGIASGANYLTNTFNALAIGWRSTSTNSATTIDINSISVNSMLTVSTTVETAAVTLGNLNQTYDGAAHPVTANTVPPGLDVFLTYNGSATAPTNIGSYTVIGTVDDANYVGSATNTLVIGPSLTSPNLDFQVAGGQLQLSWPADHLGWTLQIQTNQLNVGLGTNWMDMPDSTNSIQANIPIVPANESVFLRLVYH